MNAIDEDNDKLTYSVVTYPNTTDANLFSINPITGQLGLRHITAQCTADVSRREQVDTKVGHFWAVVFIVALSRSSYGKPSLLQRFVLLCTFFSLRIAYNALVKDLSHIGLRRRTSLDQFILDKYKKSIQNRTEEITYFSLQLKTLYTQRFMREHNYRSVFIL